MLSIPPPVYRKRRGRPKLTGTATPPPPPPPPPPSGGTVVVQSVNRTDATELVWNLGAEVTVSAPSDSVQILYDGVWVTMPFSASGASDVISGFVDNTALATQWRVINTQAGNITPNLIYQASGTIF